MLCLPLKLKTTAAVIKEMKKVGKKADLIEIWFDQIKDLDLAALIKNAPLPLIGVNKPKREKGDFSGSEKKRIEILKEAINLGIAYVDISLNTDQKLIKELVKNKKKTKIIVSYHDFTRTPPVEEMLNIIKKAYHLGADIAKIAVRAKTAADNLKIFELTRQICPQQKLISLCLGKQGKISRIVCPMLGSYLMYAPISAGKKSTEGQITISKLRNIWKLLK